MRVFLGEGEMSSTGGPRLVPCHLSHERWPLPCCSLATLAISFPPEDFAYTVPTAQHFPFLSLVTEPILHPQVSIWMLFPHGGGACIAPKLLQLKCPPTIILTAIPSNTQ